LASKTARIRVSILSWSRHVVSLLAENSDKLVIFEFQSSRGRGTSSAGRGKQGRALAAASFNPLVVEARRQPPAEPVGNRRFGSMSFNPLVVEARRQPGTPDAGGAGGCVFQSSRGRGTSSAGAVIVLHPRAQASFQSSRGRGTSSAV